MKLPIVILSTTVLVSICIFMPCIAITYNKNKLKKYCLLCLTTTSQNNVMTSIHRAPILYLSWKIGSVNLPTMSAMATADMHIAVWLLSKNAVFYNKRTRSYTLMAKELSYSMRETININNCSIWSCRQLRCFWLPCYTNTFFIHVFFFLN